MVRLKELIDIERNKFAYSFQFQYGAIKRSRFFKHIQFKIKFQFQYGAIKSRTTTIPTGRQRNFNSSMVRLKEQGLVLGNSNDVISIPVWCD